MEKKGSSQTVWIIIALVIALVVAVILITVFSGTTGKVEGQTNPTINTGGGALSATTCRILCESCKLSSDPTNCLNTKGPGCITLVPTC